MSISHEEFQFHVTQETLNNDYKLKQPTSISYILEDIPVKCKYKYVQFFNSVQFPLKKKQ